jgi:hypothetical protein
MRCTLMMEAAGSSETSIHFYQIATFYTSECTQSTNEISYDVLQDVFYNTRQFVIACVYLTVCNIGFTRIVCRILVQLAVCVRNCAF